MRSIADEIDVVGSETGLQRTVPPALLMEAVSVELHAAAHEQRARVRRNEAAIDFQWDAVLFKSLEHDIDYARRVVISLSPLCILRGGSTIIPRRRKWALNRLTCPGERPGIA